jgi:hypothetical protein
MGVFKRVAHVADVSQGTALKTRVGLMLEDGWWAMQDSNLRPAD